MAAHRERIVIPLVLGLALTGCASPFPFHRPGEGAPDAPVVALGGAAPYVRPRPAADGRGAAQAPRLYVANTHGIDVIDPVAGRLVGRLPGGASGIVPGWDLRRLWAVSAAGLVPLRPPGAPIRVEGITGLYFTPDGRHALTLADRRVEFRDPHTMAPRASVPLPCTPEYATFSADGTSLITTCGRAARLLRIDLARRKAAGGARLPGRAHPGDLRLSPDGGTLYVADPVTGGVWLLDAYRLAKRGFVRAPAAQSLAVAPGARHLFIVGGSTITAIDLRTRRPSARWPLNPPPTRPEVTPADGHRSTSPSSTPPSGRTRFPAPRSAPPGTRAAAAPSAPSSAPSSGRVPTGSPAPSSASPSARGPASLLGPNSGRPKVRIPARSPSPGSGSPDGPRPAGSSPPSGAAPTGREADAPVPGGFSLDGRLLWLADPRGLVYAISTRTGRVQRKVWVGGRPAGACVHPRPGTRSLGGTGQYR